MSMNPPEPNDARCRSEPIEQAAEDERVPPVDARPRVSIAEALRNHWVEVWYQPKIDLKRKCLAGAEALAAPAPPAAWRAGAGQLSRRRSTKPASSSLRSTALVATLCDWTMFDEAGFNLHLAINVPVGVLLRDADCRRWSPNIVRNPQHGPGSSSKSTEDQIARDIALAKDIAAQLRGSGISIAIDDFGAGYSSFSSLRDLPFAELKIDRSFVRNCATDATNAAICQTAIDLAHRFGSAAVGRRRRKPGRPAGADGDGLRLRPGRADRAADAEGALPRTVAPAHEQAARGRGGQAAAARTKERPRGLRRSLRYFILVRRTAPSILPAAAL